jgi:hypothetical protein
MAVTRATREPLPHWVNETQAAVLRSYEGGEFAHLLDASTASAFQEGLGGCGDGLLRFLMVELAESEGVDSVEEGLRRVNMAVDQLRAIADTLASKIFNESAG